MTRGSRISVPRIALIVLVVASLLALTIARPSWPRDAWLKATTRSVPFEFSSLGACDERNAYQPDQIWLAEDRKRVEGYVSLNCADKPGEPSASRRGDTIFLRTKSLPIDPDSQLSAACYCSNKIRFDFNDQVRPGQQVVLIIGSLESAKLIAP